VEQLLAATLLSSIPGFESSQNSSGIIAAEADRVLRDFGPEDQHWTIDAAGVAVDVSMCVIPFFCQ